MSFSRIRDRYSFYVCLLLIALLAEIRWLMPTFDSHNVLAPLTWDAMGYYLYLPGKFIYHDLHQFKWIPEILRVYAPTGSFYQAFPIENGNMVIKYPIGLCLLYLPFFWAGHFMAGWTGHAQDGFSMPYQLWVCLGALAYAGAGLFALRRVLLAFCSDRAVAIALLLLVLATNYPQYVSVDSAMAHGFLFSMYAFVLYLVWRWHREQRWWQAVLTGVVIGLSTIARPSELVMCAIPLLWAVQDRQKWALLRRHPGHVGLLVAATFVAALPQLLYWKALTGHYLFQSYTDARFDWFSPYWQVLFGWTKGWFNYTPLAFFLVAGFFVSRRQPFFWAVLAYFFINTWTVIAWFEWKYGGSYSCRALVQSYAALALPFGILVDRVLRWRWRHVVYVLWLAMINVNLFQIWQYNKGYLTFDDMTRRYYFAIFMKPNPKPIDYSLLDTKEIIRDESLYQKKLLYFNDFESDTSFHALECVSQYSGRHSYAISSAHQYSPGYNTLVRGIPGYGQGREQWLKVSAMVWSDWGAYDSYLVTSAEDGGQSYKFVPVRLHHADLRGRQWNLIEYYYKVPPQRSDDSVLKVYAVTNSAQRILIDDLKVELLER